MATDYDSLKTEIQRWADNDNANFVAEIPTFIQDCEKWAGRHLHTRDMECVTTTPLVPAGATEDDVGIYGLPSDWGGHKSVTIVGDLLQIHYWQKIPALSGTVTTNWLLDKYPDLYRYGSLMSAEAFLKNDPRIGTWAAKAGEILKEVEAHDDHDRFSGGPLQSRMPSERPWLGDGAPGRLEYLVPFDFFDAESRGTLDTAQCSGVFTVTQTHIRILPKPALPA